MANDAAATTTTSPASAARGRGGQRPARPATGYRCTAAKNAPAITATPSSLSASSLQPIEELLQRRQRGRLRLIPTGPFLTTAALGGSCGSCAIATMIDIFVSAVPTAAAAAAESPAAPDRGAAPAGGDRALGHVERDAAVAARPALGGVDQPGAVLGLGGGSSQRVGGGGGGIAIGRTPGFAIDDGRTGALGGGSCCCCRQRQRRGRYSHRRTCCLGCDRMGQPIVGRRPNPCWREKLRNVMSREFGTNGEDRDQIHFQKDPSSGFTGTFVCRSTGIQGPLLHFRRLESPSTLLRTSLASSVATCS